MFHLRDFHKLGRQALSMLRLYFKDKAQGNTDKTEIDDDAEDKKNVSTKSPTILTLFAYVIISLLM